MFVNTFDLLHLFHFNYFPQYFVARIYKSNCKPWGKKTLIKEVRTWTWCKKKKDWKLCFVALRIWKYDAIPRQKLKKKMRGNSWSEKRQWARANLKRTRVVTSKTKMFWMKRKIVPEEVSRIKKKPYSL